MNDFGVNDAIRTHCKAERASEQAREREKESRFISVRRNVMADYKQIAYLHWPIE